MLGKKLKATREKLGLNQSDFGKAIGVGGAQISKIELGLSTFSFEALKKLREVFKIDINYFLDEYSSINEIELAEEKGLQYFKKFESGSNQKMIPILDIDLISSTPIEINISKNSKGFISLPGFTDCKTAFEITSKSMIPKINPSDIVICKEIGITEIEFGQAYILVIEGHRFIKTIKPHYLPTHLLLRSENRDFDDMEIEKSSIKTLFLIKGKINHYSL